MNTQLALTEHFSSLPDPRKTWLVKHQLIDIVVWLKQRGDWEGLKSVGLVERERVVGDKKSYETHLYISSLEADAEEFAQAVRSHWEVENRLHWVLDIAFREDESRIRNGNGAENMSTIRKIALNLLRQEKTLKRGIKAKRLKAGWDRSYLTKVINLLDDQYSEPLDE